MSRRALARTSLFCGLVIVVWFAIATSGGEHADRSSEPRLIPSEGEAADAHEPLVAPVGGVRREADATASGGAEAPDDLRVRVIDGATGEE